MDQFGIGSVVWASARRDIFWPGEVTESNKDGIVSSKQIITVHFFIEDSYEDIKSINKLFAWNCAKQHKFIEKGRASKNAERRLMFNKAVAEADGLFALRSQENKEGISSLQGMSCPLESPSRRGKGAKQKFQKNGESETSVLWRSLRKKMANGHSSECFTPTVKKSVKKVTEDQGSKAADVCNSVENNCEQVRLPCVKLDEAATDKGSATLTAVCPARRSLINSKTTVDSSQKCDSDVSISVGKKRGKRKDRSKDLTLTERQNATSSDSHVQCNNHDASSKRNCPPKRRLLDEDASSKKEKKSSKNLKPSDQNGLERLASKKALANGHKDGVVNKELGGSNRTFSEYQAAEDAIGTGVCGAPSEDMSSSDDELMAEAFSPVESNKFLIGDIVWAKFYREPYWPAQIKKLTKEKKFVVRFLGWNDGLFKIQPKKLTHFACDSIQRAEFMRVKTTLNDQHEKLFDQALVQAEDLLNRKGLGMSLDEEIHEGDAPIFEEKDDDIRENSGKEEDADQSEDRAQSSSTNLFECRKSLRAKKPVSKYSNILSYIRQAKPTLKGILNGTKASERHQIFIRGRVSEKDNLKRRSGFGPIADENLRDDIMDLLKKFYQELKGTPDITYLSDVWLPEAIIWSISQIDHVDRQTAEKMFREGCKYAVSNDEVLELTTKLKQRKSSDEEKQETLRRAERCVERYLAES